MPDRLATIYNNLSNLLEAGIPVVRATKIICPGNKGTLKTALEQIAEEVADGNTISDAMEKHPNVFAKLDILTIKAGETTGRVEEILKKLAQWHEFGYRIKRKLLNGLLLPILMIHLVSVLGPLPSLILGNKNIGQYLTSAAIILTSFYVPVILVVLIYKNIPDKGRIKQIFDALILKAPLLGPAIEALNIARFTMSFSMMTASAIPPAAAVKQAVSTVKNSVIAGWFAPMADSGRAGNPLSEGLSLANVGDYYFQSWQIGEESGDIDDVTNRLARVYLEKAETMFSHFAFWLPKLIYAYVAVIMIIQILKGFSTIINTTTGGL